MTQNLQRNVSLSADRRQQVVNNNQTLLQPTDHQQTAKASEIATGALQAVVEVERAAAIHTNAAEEKAANAERTARRLAAEYEKAEENAASLRREASDFTTYINQQAATAVANAEERTRQQAAELLAQKSEHASRRIHELEQKLAAEQRARTAAEQRLDSAGARSHTPTAGGAGPPDGDPPNGSTEGKAEQIKPERVRNGTDQMALLLEKLQSMEAKIANLDKQPSTKAPKTKEKKPPSPSSSSDEGDSSESSSGESQNTDDGQEETGVPVCWICGNPHSPSVCPQRESMEADRPKKEADIVRIKDLKDLKLPAAPKDASEGRGYVNAVMSSLDSFDKTEEGHILRWLAKSMTAKDLDDLEDSEGFVVLDKSLRVELQRTYKHGTIGLKFQDLIEERKAAMLSSKGRVKLPTGRQFAKIAIDELEIDKEYGYLLGQDYLLELKIAGTGWKDLNMFKTKADLVLKQLPARERPSETTLRRWLVKNLQQQPLLARTMELYDESRAKSSKRTFHWLWDRLDRVVRRKRQEDNQANVSNAFANSAAPGITQDGKNNKLPGGSGLTLTSEQKKAARAAKRKEKKEKKKAEEQQQSGNSRTLPSAPGKTKGKGKGKGKKKNGSDQKKEPTAAEKAQMATIPCRFYAANACNRGAQCYFLHDDNNLSSRPCTPRGTPGKGSDSKGKGKGGAKGAAALKTAAKAGAAAAGATGAGAQKAGHKYEPTGKQQQNGDKESAPSWVQKIFGTVCAPMRKAALQTTRVLALSAGFNSQFAGRLERDGGMVRAHILQDTGTGRSMANAKDMLANGFAPSTASEALIFDTANGTVEVDESFTVCGKEFYAMNGPFAESVGRSVNQEGHAFVWMPPSFTGREPEDNVPFTVPPEAIHKMNLDIPDEACFSSYIVEDVPVNVVSIADNLRQTETNAKGSRSRRVSATPASAEMSEKKVEPQDELANSYSDEWIGPNPEAASSAAPPVHESAPRKADGEVASPRLEDADRSTDKEEVTKKSDDLGPLSIEHLNNHSPPRADCEFCRAKERNTPRRRLPPEAERTASDGETPKEYCDVVVADHLIVVKGDEDLSKKGLSGERVALIAVDAKSRSIQAYPASTKSGEESIAALLRFSGKRQIGEISGDNAPELIYASQQLRASPPSGIPYRYSSIINAEMNALENLCRCNVAQAGEFERLWPFALQHAATARTTDFPTPGEAISRWESVNGSAFKGKTIPFSALVKYKPLKPNMTSKLGSNMRYGLFMKHNIEPGLKYEKFGMTVLDLEETFEALQKGKANLQDQPTVQVEVQQPVSFPLAKARERLVRGESNVFESLKLDSKKVIPDSSGERTTNPSAASGEEVKLTVEAKPRRFYITTERLIEAGPTPGCSGCDNGTANHSEACRKRIADFFANKESSRKAIFERATLKAPAANAIATGNSAVCVLRKHLEDFDGENMIERKGVSDSRSPKATLVAEHSPSDCGGASPTWSLQCATCVDESANVRSA